MSQPVILKVYGNLFPVEKFLATQLERCCKNAIGYSFGQDYVKFSNALLLVSFEGIFFPVDDFIEIVENYLKPSESVAPNMFSKTGHEQGVCFQKGILKGKLDVLDLEKWLLVRYLVEDGKVERKKAPLNNVLDYSGH